MAAYIFVLPKISGGFSLSSSSGGSGATVTTHITSVVTATTPVTAVITAAQTPTPDPFPNTLELKDGFPFGSGNLKSKANVYRVWMNDIY